MLKTNQVVDNELFFIEMRPNRSLTTTGRRLWFLFIAGTTFLLACIAMAFGAWMVLPYAGLEVLFLWYAFRIISRHDGDYERLRVADREFCWTRCECGQVDMLCGNTAWVRVVALARNGRLGIGLRYQGKTVSVGQLISDEQRLLLRRDLVRALKIGAAT